MKASFLQSIEGLYSSAFHDTFPRVPHEPLSSSFFPTAFTPSAGPSILIDELECHTHRYPNLCHVCQPCLRYWDLENVSDSSHLSFFEMVACSSFLPDGRWTTMQSIFQFLTRDCGIAAERFWATRFRGGHVMGCGPFDADIVALDILRDLGFADSQIVAVDGVDGFVANTMEPIGGYRCELYVDIGPTNPGCHNCLPGQCRCGRFLELVTSVAYDFQVQHSHDRFLIQPLSSQFMHATGFGVERLESILAGTGIIHQTPRFIHLLPFLEEGVCGIILPYSDKIRIIDTACALLFLHAETGLILAGKANRSRRWVMNKWIKRWHEFNQLGLRVIPLLNAIRDCYSPRYPHLLQTDANSLYQALQALA